MNFSTSVQNISWFRDRYREGTLAIKPPYQRKPVWVARQKCYLIESILRGLPVPEIYIQQITTPEGNTTYAIVDGQQRIRSVLQFVGSETDAEEMEYNKFSLDKIEISSEWHNVNFAELPPDVKKKFYGYQFAVRYLDTDDEEEVRDMFRRLNKYLVPLKPQELRNATYTGPFVKLTLALANNEYWAENRIVTAAAIRRMNDVEYVSELLIGLLHGPQGGNAAVIDEYYKQYEDYEDEFPDQKRTVRLFEITLNQVQALLPNIKETRWSNKTDFYTLFVAFGTLSRSHEFITGKEKMLQKKLADFEAEINSRLSDDQYKTTTDVVSYVRAVEKGANDKKRRADRHEAMVTLLTPFFRPKDKKKWAW
jgi:hypothetical protein